MLDEPTPASPDGTPSPSREELLALPGYTKKKTLAERKRHVTQPGVIAYGAGRPLSDAERADLLKTVRSVFNDLMDVNKGINQTHAALAARYLEWVNPALRNCQDNWQAMALLANRLKGAKPKSAKSGKQDGSGSGGEEDIISEVVNVSTSEGSALGCRKADNPSDKSLQTTSAEDIRCDGAKGLSAREHERSTDSAGLGEASSRMAYKRKGQTGSGSDGEERSLRPCRRTPAAV